MPSFDGPNTTITLDSGVTVVDVIDIYSEWKEWVKLGTNSAFLPAFRVIGGDDLGGGVSAGSYFFLRNDFGWRIKPPEEDIDVTLNGNLYRQDTGLPLLIGTVGNFNTFVQVQLSSLTQVAAGGGGTADLTTLPDGEVKDALIIINQGVQKSSLLIPHTTNIDGTLTGGGIPDIYVLETEVADPESGLVWNSGEFN